ncbi:MAG: LytTR family DNA-binding domain-containing protein [Bacteroidota bacterium]|nr:LytTR family DNA-binding domain-containing protein [Bacteroidota bacterium]MDP4191419.1 LytTR family DNA-binding domain-containing protein [Bacteroidota bacterium]MDP4193642.1 LytTR family DNA-binding domain-containing protein [Bacteroidota bacterium]
MKVLIIEDEAPASRRLQKLLKEIDPALEIIESLESVESSVRWLKNNPAPDVIFMDIQLSDALSFEIFKSINVDSPVIFTTAYDEYAIQAFKVNSIDYLLKPIDSSELCASLEKLKKIKDSYSVSYKAGEIAELLKTFTPSQPAYKSRFLIKIGTNLLIIQANDIAYFYVDNKITYLVNRLSKKYIIDFSLEELEEILDPTDFFRANRSFILNINSIETISYIFSGKLKVKLKIKTDGDIIVSREKTSSFRQWLDR